MFQLFEIFIVIRMDWNRARKYGLLCEKRQHLPLRSHISEELTPKHRMGPFRGLFELGSNRSKAQTKEVKKLNSRHGKNAF